MSDQEESLEFESQMGENYRQVSGQGDQLNDDQSIIYNQCVSSLYGQQIKLPRSRLLQQRTMFGIAPSTGNMFYLANDQLPPQRSSLLFPISRELYEFIESKQQLQELMSFEQKRNNLLLDIKIYEICRKLIKKLIIVCNSCGAKLLMKLIMNNQSRKEDRYKLVYFDNTHIHQNQKNLLLNSQFKYRVFLKELQLQDKRTTVQELLKSLGKKYNITLKDFRNFFSNIQEKRDQEMQNLLKFLKNYNSKVWMSQKISINNLLELQLFDDQQTYTKDPDFFMFSVDYMYQNCKQYHKICSFSIIPGFIQNKKPTFKKWDIICFSGLNSFNDLVPFAFAFLNQKADSIDLVSHIIRKFFKQFTVQPHVVITPYSEYYTYLIEIVKKYTKLNFLHIYDGIYHIDSIGQKLKDTNDRIYYQNIILSKTKHQFQQNCELLMKKVDPTSGNMQILNELIQIAPKMVFGMIQTHQLIGLIFRHSANKYVLNLIRQIFTKQVLRRSEHKIQIPKIVCRKWKNNKPSLIKSIFLIIRSALRYNKDIMKDQILKGGYCQWRGENYLGLPQVENIRINVKKEFLDLIMEQYGKIFEMQAAQRNLKDPSLPEMKTFDVYDKKCKSIFVVSPCPQYANQKQFSKFVWKCNCCYSFKSGLPCAHQIKVAVVTDTSLMEQIHQLWLKKRVYAQNLKKRGRTKGTRRNTEK